MAKQTSVAESSTSKAITKELAVGWRNPREKSRWNGEKRPKT
jgi:hypothetical protein